MGGGNWIGQCQLIFGHGDAREWRAEIALAQVQAADANFFVEILRETEIVHGRNGEFSRLRDVDRAGESGGGIVHHDGEVIERERSAAQQAMAGKFLRWRPCLKRNIRGAFIAIGFDMAEERSGERAKKRNFHLVIARVAAGAVGGKLKFSLLRKIDLAARPHEILAAFDLELIEIDPRRIESETRRQ